MPCDVSSGGSDDDNDDDDGYDDVILVTGCGRSVQLTLTQRIWKDREKVS